MKTLQECKNEVLKYKGFKDFNEAGYDAAIGILNEAAELYAQSARAEAWEEMKIKVIAERKRAVDICYEIRDNYLKSEQSKRKVGNELAFIDGKIAEELRLTGNYISGLTALSLNESIASMIEKELGVNPYKS